jgi:hypothetical protein
MLHLKHRKPGAIYEQMIKRLRGVSNNAERPVAEGLVDIAIAVGRAALYRHENCTRFDAPRVILNAGNRLRRFAGAAYSGNFGGQFFPVHVVFDCSGRERLTLSGASVSLWSDLATPGDELRGCDVLLDCLWFFRVFVRFQSLLSIIAP